MGGSLLTPRIVVRGASAEEEGDILHLDVGSTERACTDNRADGVPLMLTNTPARRHIRQPSAMLLTD